MDARRRTLAMATLALLVGGSVSFVLTPSRVRAQTAPSADPDWPPAVEALITSRCVSCHGIDLIAQQRIERADWISEVAKMRRWGATLTDDEARVLADGLAASLPANLPDPVFEHGPADEAVRSVAPQPLPWDPGTAEYGHALYNLHCATCHGADARGGRGPALVGRVIAQRPLDFDRVVRAGRHEMPAFARLLTERGIANVFAWIAR